MNYIRSSTLRQASRSYATGLAPPRKIGAIKGSLFGFLLGVTLTGVGSYYYLLDKYKLANGIIIADVAALQSSVADLEVHVKAIEDSKK
ncbi:uncharacterized protein PRCAT00001302001 [Priceomyces carsonii]|uniref:uncharacterized protein n=1 Tax=Priceomyces carsonii TaxID=28549 RepID=UPI002ED99239|nr:unnamed protein product [Priceomyces carsonii]